MATGLPSVRPWRTPAVTSARSFSIFMRPPRPWPSWRRARSASMSSGRSSRPAGSPSTIAVSPGPWDSPVVTNRKDMTPTPYKRGCGRQVGGGTAGRGLLSEGLPVHAGARMGVRCARVERVDAVRTRTETRIGEHDARVGDGAAREAAVAVEVVGDLVELRDVDDVVVVLVVLAVEQRVAVDVGVGHVELRERTDGEGAELLAAGGRRLRPRVGLHLVLGEEARPPARLARAARGLEEVREPIAVRVALIIAPRGVAMQVVGGGERVARCGKPVRWSAPGGHRRSLARAAELGAVAVAKRGLQVEPARLRGVERAARVTPGAVLLEAREPVTVEVVGTARRSRRPAVARVERVGERALAGIGHGLDVQVLGRPVLPAIGHLVAVGVGQAGVRPDRQLEAVREQVAVVVSCAVAYIDAPAATGAVAGAGARDHGREALRGELRELAREHAQLEPRRQLAAVGYLEQARNRGGDPDDELAPRRTARLGEGRAAVARAEDHGVLGARGLEAPSRDRERAADADPHRLDARDRRRGGRRCGGRSRRQHEESRGDQREAGGDDATHALSLSALWVVVGVLEAIAGHDYEVGQDREHESARRSYGRARLRALALRAGGGRVHLHLADLVDLDGVGVAVVLGEDVLGAGADVRERALGLARLAAALAGCLERGVDQEHRVGALGGHAHEDQERRRVARQHVELLHALDVPRAAVRREGQVDHVLVDGRGGPGAAAGRGASRDAAGNAAGDAAAGRVVGRAERWEPGAAGRAGRAAAAARARGVHAERVLLQPALGRLEGVVRVEHAERRAGADLFLAELDLGQRGERLTVGLLRRGRDGRGARVLGRLREQHGHGHQSEQEDHGDGSETLLAQVLPEIEEEDLHRSVLTGGLRQRSGWVSERAQEPGSTRWPEWSRWRAGPSACRRASSRARTAWRLRWRPA